MKRGDLVLHRRTDCRAIVLEIVTGDTGSRRDDAVKVCWLSSCAPTTPGYAWRKRSPGETEWVAAGALELLTSS